MTRRKLVIIGLVALALGLVVLFRPSLHIGYIAEDEKEARDKIEEFHNRHTAGEFERIYEDLDIVLTSKEPREVVIPKMHQMRDRWGRVETVTYSYVKVLIERAPVEVRAVYNTRFEKGDATEMFLFVRRGSKLKLAYYNVVPGTTRPTIAP